MGGCVGYPSQCLFVCVSDCLFICLPACLPVCLSVCLPACLSVGLLVSVSVCLSSSLSVSVCACLSPYLHLSGPLHRLPSSCQVSSHQLAQYQLLFRALFGLKHLEVTLTATWQLMQLGTRKAARCAVGGTRLAGWLAGWLVGWWLVGVGWLVAARCVAAPVVWRAGRDAAWLHDFPAMWRVGDL